MEVVKLHGKWEFSAEKIAEGYRNIPVEVIIELERDGRVFSPKGEHLAAIEMGGTHWGGKSPFDIKDKYENRIECRCITKYGTYLCPNYMVGTGRKFKLKEFEERLNNVEGYFFYHISEFPEKVYFFIIPISQIKKWWYEDKIFGKTSKMSKKKFLKLMEEYFNRSFS